MKLRLNLSPTSDAIREIYQPKQSVGAAAAFRAACRHCLPCFVLMLALFQCNKRHYTDGVLSSWAQLKTFESIRLKSINSSASSHQISALKKNFLANEKIQDDDLKDDFRSSGLSHLLALSGGQTTPAAMLVCNFFIVLLLLGLRLFPRINAVLLLPYLRLLSLLLRTTVIACLVGLYQSTGALSRSLAGQFTDCLRGATLISSSRHEHNVDLIQPLCTCLPWLLSWFWLANPAGDLSFLLSALGAQTSVCVHQVLKHMMQRPDRPMPNTNKNPSSLQKFIPHLNRILDFCLAVVSTALTSSLVGLLTWPFWPPAHLDQKIYANLIAGPCVLLLITPASLAVCVAAIVNNNLLFQFAHTCLDWGLKLLLRIAQAFSTPTHLDLESSSHRRDFYGINLSISYAEAFALIGFEIAGLLLLSEFLRRLRYQQ
jgi:hypothetical protein